MKRLWIVLFLLVCAAALAQDTEKKQSPIEGWKVVKGDWRNEADGASCQAGYLQWEGEVKRVIDLQFVLVVREWQQVDYARAVGIIWNAKDMQSWPDEQWKRNLALIRSDGHISIEAQPERADAPRQTTAFTCPANKPIPVRAKISRKGIQILVGKEKMSVEIPSEALGKLQLHVSGADAVFSKVIVKSK